MIKNKHIYLILFLVVVVLLILSFNMRFYVIATCKYLSGRARLVNNSTSIELKIDGKDYKGKLYKDMCKELVDADGTVKKNINCYILCLNGPQGNLYYRIGDDWVGTFSYGGSNVISFFNKLLVSETAEKTFNIRSNIKSYGAKYNIIHQDHNIVYNIEKLGDMKNISFVIKEEQTPKNNNVL